jgi:hypothetical protein
MRSRFQRLQRGCVLAEASDPRHARPREAGSTAREIEGGIRTRFSLERSIRNLHHQPSLLRSFGWQASLTASRRSENIPGEQSRRIPPSREVRLQRSIRSSSPPGIRRRKSRQNFIANMVAALWIMARRRSEPFGSPRHRWTESLRSRRSLRRAPRFACMTQAGVRVPRSGKSRTAIGASGAGGSENKKPSGAAAREGLSNDRCRFALCETASMSCACAIDWPIAIRQLRKAFHCLLHRSTHVLSRDTMSARGRLVLLRKYQVKPVAHNRSFANGRSGRVLAVPTPSDGSDFALRPGVHSRCQKCGAIVIEIIPKTGFLDQLPRSAKRAAFLNAWPNRRSPTIGDTPSDNTATESEFRRLCAALSHDCRLNRRVTSCRRFRMRRILIGGYFPPPPNE